MKKNTLYVGVTYLVVGILLILFGVLGPKVPFENFIWGMGGSCIGPGAVLIYKYLYWSKPENSSEYEKKLKLEEINRNDERKIMLRDKSGRITYIITLVILLIINIVFSLMNVDRFVLVTLWSLLLFMYVGGIIIFNILSKKL
jgi:hypothetical protein